MTQNIINPVLWSQIEDGMTPAEERFADCVAQGAACNLGNAVPQDETPDNQVRAEVIRFFVFGGDEEHPVRGAAINLRGAWVVEALNLDDVQIPFTLFFANCHFVKSIFARQTRCVSLYLDRTLLAGGLRGDGLRASGSVYLRKGFSSQDEVRLLSAQIRGNLECVGGKFNNPKGDAINLQNAEIKGIFFWESVAGGGVADFRSAKAGVFVDDVEKVYGKESPNPSFKMRLEGFTYNRLVHPGSASSRLHWLANRPADAEFSPLPFEQAANVLFAMGHGDDARKILLEKEREQTRVATFSWRKVGRVFWGLLAGYGYRLRRTLGWSVGMILAGALVFHYADQFGRIVPHQPIVLANAEYLESSAADEQPTETVKRLFPDYPRFNAIAFSVDVFIPFFALHQEPYWYPRPKDAGTDWIACLLLGWYWLQIAMGWILTSLFLLSVTGLLRPRQHSGKD